MRKSMLLGIAVCATLCASCGSKRSGWDGVSGATARAAETKPSGAGSDPAQGTPAERRQALFDAVEARGANALPALRQGLRDENALVRRAAVGLIVSLGKPGESALDEALSNADPLVRRTAAGAIARRGVAGLPLLERALGDPDEDVRVAAASALAAMQPRTGEVLRLLQIAQKDAAPSVRKPVAAALWPFQREVVLFRDRPDVRDQITSVTVTARIPLPKDGWRFKTDAAEDGHLHNWFAPAFDDSKWAKIPIEEVWDKAGFDHEGIAWYRRAFTLPARPEAAAVEMRFGAVDEGAWVWINGEYAGCHDIGPSGWDMPFAVDATPFLRWGGENHVAVRVLNSTGAGGIWKPVTIEALMLK